MKFKIGVCAYHDGSGEKSRSLGIKKSKYLMQNLGSIKAITKHNYPKFFDEHTVADEVASKSEKGILLQINIIMVTFALQKIKNE